MALTIQSFSFLRNTMIVAGYAIDIQGLRNQEAAANHYNCRQNNNHYSPLNDQQSYGRKIHINSE